MSSSSPAISLPSAKLHVGQCVLRLLHFLKAGQRFVEHTDQFPRQKCENSNLSVCRQSCDAFAIVGKAHPRHNCLVLCKLVQIYRGKRQGRIIYGRPTRFASGSYLCPASNRMTQSSMEIYNRFSAQSNILIFQPDRRTLPPRTEHYI